MIRRHKYNGVVQLSVNLLNYDGILTTSVAVHIILSIVLADIALCQLDEEAEFVDMQLNFTYVQGDLATLYCRVNNLGRRSVIWRRTSQPSPISVGTDIFAPDDRYHVQHIPYRGSWNLLIKNVQTRDAGVYECQISAKERAGSRRLVLLTVIDPPPTTAGISRKPEIEITGKSIVEIGSVIELDCNASTLDFPADDIDWFKDGHLMKENFKTQISKHVALVENSIHSELTVKEATLSDAGIYVCRTSDKQITGIRVHVLSARSQNSKRGTNGKGSSAKGYVTSTSGTQNKQSYIYLVTCIISILFLKHRRT